MFSESKYHIHSNKSDALDNNNGTKKIHDQGTIYKEKHRMHYKAQDPNVRLSSTRHVTPRQ
jgi:hypothetical protein